MNFSNSDFIGNTHTRDVVHWIKTGATVLTKSTPTISDIEDISIEARNTSTQKIIHQVVTLARVWGALVDVRHTSFASEARNTGTVKAIYQVSAVALILTGVGVAFIYLHTSCPVCQIARIAFADEGSSVG